MNKIVALFLLLFSINAMSETPCDEWANFTKIITFRGRDKGVDIQIVKRGLENGPMSGNPEMPIALGLVDFSYSHPQLNSIQIWNAIYSKCKEKPTL